jgi:plastocyanin
VKGFLSAGALASVAAAVALAGPASAGLMATEIEFGDDFYDPENVTVFQNAGANEGIWVRATGSTGEHNVREDSRLFRSGPVRDDDTFNEYQASISAGAWHYYCEIHGDTTTGMEGTIRVRPDFQDPDGSSALIRWADPGDETGDAYRVQWRRGSSGRWQTWLKATGRPAARFGKADNPTNARPSATYQVRVRSFVRSRPRRGSGFSPPVSFSVKPLAP